MARALADWTLPQRHLLGGREADELITTISALPLLRSCASGSSGALFVGSPHEAEHHDPGHAEDGHADPEELPAVRARSAVALAPEARVLRLLDHLAGCGRGRRLLCGRRRREPEAHQEADRE